MNIAFATNRLVKFCASSNYTVSILEELSKQNMVDLYAFSIERDIPKNVRQFNYTGNNEHNLLSVLYVIKEMNKLAKKFSKYDMVIIAGPDITILPIIHLAKFFNRRIKLVWDFHGLTPAIYVKDIKGRFLTRIRQIAFYWSMKRSDYIKVDSDYIKKEVENKIGNKNINVINIGINIDRFKNTDIKDIKTKYKLNDKFIMIYVGRLVASKHIDFLIESMQYLDAILLIIGDGEDKDNLKQKVNENKNKNLKDKIIFIGKVSDEELPGYYSISDIFVTASLHEGFCVPIIESFASGKPVIVPNKTAMPETAADAGLVYESESINDFVAKVNSIKNDKNLNEKLCKNAIERSKIYDIKNSLQSYYNFIIITE